MKVILHQAAVSEIQLAAGKMAGQNPLGQAECVTLSGWLQGACKWAPLGIQNELETVF